MGRGVNDVAIVGYGVARFNRDKHSSYSLYELAVQAVVDMFNNMEFDTVVRDGIDTLIASTTDGRAYTASILADMLGIRARIVNRVESMCSSGSDALITAYSYIASGLSDIALVVGFDSSSSGLLLDWDIARGDMRHPAHWAAVYAKRHMQEFGTTREQLAMIAVKNRRSAMANCKAYFYHYNKAITVDDVLNSKPVVEPLRLYDCSIACNGAASILLSNAEMAKIICKDPIWIRGIGSSSIGASINSIDLTEMHATVDAARQAYDMSNIRPEMVDVAQVHDSFTILELMAYEDLGFVSKGEGGYAAEGRVSIPAVNTDGGILGRGHSSSATGIAQIAEIVMQLMHKAGNRQIKDCSVGLVHNMAVAGTRANVIILGDK